MERIWLLFVALIVAGCGAQPAGPGPSGTVSGTNGPFQAQAAPASLPAGGTVRLTLTVTGPIDYEIGCVQTLHIWAEDSQHQTIWQEPVPAIMCMAFGHKQLAAGETASFTAVWPTSSQLAPGTYTLHGLFLTVLPMGAQARVRENLPPLSIQILG
jgi:Intracellular proteinase inhibitor